MAVQEFSLKSIKCIEDDVDQTSRRRQLRFAEANKQRCTNQAGNHALRSAITQSRNAKNRCC